MNNNYKLISNLLQESYKKIKDEKVLKSYPFITVEFYHEGKLLFKKIVLPRITITDKRIIFDRLSTLVHFPLDSFFQFYRKYRQEISVPYNDIKDLKYDKNKSSIVLKIPFNHTIIFKKKIGDSKDIYDLILKMKS